MSAGWGYVLKEQRSCTALPAALRHSAFLKAVRQGTLKMDCFLCFTKRQVRGKHVWQWRKGDRRLHAHTPVLPLWGGAAHTVYTLLSILLTKKTNAWKMLRHTTW